MIPAMIERIAKFVVKKDAAGKWFWHEMAANGQVIGTSGQPFYSQSDALQACENAKARAAVAPIEIEDPGRAMHELIRRLAAARVTGSGAALMDARRGGASRKR
jgi:uncharacterized protein YegP (UPF0339 family)